MTDFSDFQKRVVAFRDARDWKQFHNPKDLAISLSLEASEFLEHFQWKNPDEIKIHLNVKGEEVSEELMDVLYWVLLIANDLEIDIEKEFGKKMTINDNKYPINKSKGSHAKYTEL
ncbi:MAG: MazG-like family protein [Candidatus Saccharimonadales bacterium]